jgi:murein L,D-transpeptidase YcbB/YkuD
MYFTGQVIASVSLPVNKPDVADTSVSAILKSQLATSQTILYFPRSVERFYQQTGYKLVWVAPDTVKTHASEAMLLLDCVLHYGLNHNDYHPGELSYDKLSAMTAHGNKISNNEKAMFDIILTDAMITFMNHLHYGKFNPDYSVAKIDDGGNTAFNAGALLVSALHQKKFMSVIESAQPSSNEYANMQDHMRLLAGQYQADCYEVPQQDIIKMAINLERLRWLNSEDKTYIEINIPAYTLIYHRPDTNYQFKVIVGKPANPTPALQSSIGYFTTAPDWKVPQSIFVKEILPNALKDAAYLENNHFAIYDHKEHYITPDKTTLELIVKNPEKYYVRQSSGCDNSLGLIVFRFPNAFDIYLHDTPQQNLFAKETRDFSHGCIRVEHAEKLAALLLRNDGSANRIPSMRHALQVYQTKTFRLKKAVPIKVTYLTCEVKEGLLITYPDIYNLDKALEISLYGSQQIFSLR